MAITRRAVLKGALAAGAGAFTGTGVYGFAVERHALHEEGLPDRQGMEAG